MKKIYILIFILLFAGCSKDLKTPSPETDIALFEKEGGRAALKMAGSCFFHYDNNSGYEYSQNYSDGILKEMTLKCGWVEFVIQNYYSGTIHYMEPRLLIMTVPNNTGFERRLVMEFDDILNGKHSGKSSITVIQKGN